MTGSYECFARLLQDGKIEACTGHATTNGVSGHSIGA